MGSLVFVKILSDSLVVDNRECEVWSWNLIEYFEMLMVFNLDF